MGMTLSMEEKVQTAAETVINASAADLTSVELYVKPEENMVYYVMNKEITGSFYI